MGEKNLKDQYSFLEKQVNDYMQSLLVKTPEQVIHYFEKRLKTYRAMLEKQEVYPESIILYVQHLISEHSLHLKRVEQYMKYQKENALYSI
ncbi:hypothetical protein [Priestia abyssalis]|uniref:hypothetical protein n=1 Tax=Priestia abyssalis TaxID=1221450 RepID=UPI00099570CA|nr:hypothetical protein [Priestia abyssalis]